MSYDYWNLIRSKLWKEVFRSESVSGAGVQHRICDEYMKAEAIYLGTDR